MDSNVCSPRSLAKGIRLCTVCVLIATGCTDRSTSEDAKAPKPRVADRLVQIEVDGFDGESGDCRIAIYAAAKGFNDPEKAVAREIIPVHSKSVRCELPLSTILSESEVKQLAISAFHDKNENGRLDKNALGIPTERYGFSKNPKRGFGPPSFPQAAVNIPPENDGPPEKYGPSKPLVFSIELR